jgi:hypothetical protein
MTTENQTANTQNSNGALADKPDLKTLSQEIYVVRSTGQIQYLPFETYFTDCNKLAWWHSPEDNHFCFVTPNGYQPLNLSGPIVTKVIPWNVDSARLPSDWRGGDLQPGYLIDLRGLHMSRLHYSNSLDGGHENKLVVTLNEVDSDKDAGAVNANYDGGIPKQFLEQLKEIPQDNLYIMSWVDPLHTHRLDKFEPYQLHYVSKEQLNACQTVDEIKNEGEVLTNFLQNYYAAAGVQSGRLNPIDFVDAAKAKNAVDNNLRFFPVTCYVANLKTFCR